MRDLRDMDYAGFDQRAGGERRVTTWPLGKKRFRLLGGTRSRIVLRSQVKKLTIVAGDNGVLTAAEATGTADDRVEHRLGFGRRVRDHAQDLARGHLLFEALREVAVARFELLEQPNILDRDHGLVGESLQQADLSVVEELHLGAPESDRADRDAITRQRNSQHGSMAPLPRGLRAFWILVHRAQQVANLDRPPLQHGSAVDHATNGRDGELADTPIGNRSVMSDEA